MSRIMEQDLSDTLQRVYALKPKPYYLPLKNTLVLGFGHKARQGKDLAAQYIAQAYGAVDVRRYGFADALRAVCRVQFGMSEKDAPLLQMVGTDLYRRTDPEVWVKALYWTIREQAPKVAIITDVRFENEANFVHQVGGAVVKVERLYGNGDKFVAPDRDPNHPSETALDDFGAWDHVVSAADGDLHALYAGAGWAFVSQFYEKFGVMPFDWTGGTDRPEMLAPKLAA